MLDADGQVAANIVKAVHVEGAYCYHIGKLNATFYINIDRWFRVEGVILGISIKEYAAA